MSGTTDTHRAGTVGPGDRRYDGLTTAANGRFRCRPRRVVLPRTTDEVVVAVRDALADGLHIAVRSGGHCLEDFVDSPDTGVLVDLSGIDRIGFDDARGAFVVGAGARLGAVYRALHDGWGVTVPAGLEATVGVGGHVPGGGYGPLTRRHGSVVDHLWAVEVVTVDSRGDVRVDVATREPGDPDHDLWWAHTGGGGGSLGIVTRFWFRTPGAGGADPRGLLPTPPSSVLDAVTFWSWPDMTRDAFRRLLTNHGRWHETHSAPGCPETALFSVLTVMRRSTGMLGLLTQVDATQPDAPGILESYRAALADGVDVSHTHDVRERPWLDSVLEPRIAGDVWGLRAKCKAAYLRRSLSGAQADVVHERMTDPDYTNPLGGLLLAAYGGEVGAVAPDATAIAQRDSVLKAFYLCNWTDPAQDDEHARWIRSFYADVHAGDGGVPLPDGDCDGSYINYPDGDLADPRWNTTGVPWHTLYFKDNYPRLQRAKARWDPLDVFHHTLSVRLPGRD